MGVHGFDPLIQELALGFALIRVLPFSFEDQMISHLEPNDQVGAKFMHDAAVNVEHFETEMIVFHSSISLSS
jgi:hypothetical protein